MKTLLLVLGVLIAAPLAIGLVLGVLALSAFIPGTALIWVVPVLYWVERHADVEAGLLPQTGAAWLRQVTARVRTWWQTTPATRRLQLAGLAWVVGAATSAGISLAQSSGPWWAHVVVGLGLGLTAVPVAWAIAAVRKR